MKIYFMLKLMIHITYDKFSIFLYILLIVNLIQVLKWISHPTVYVYME